MSLDDEVDAEKPEIPCERASRGSSKSSRVVIAAAAAAAAVAVGTRVIIYIYMYICSFLVFLGVGVVQPSAGPSTPFGEPVPTQAALYALSSDTYRTPFPSLWLLATPVL